MKSDARDDDYGRIYRIDYDATYGSARAIGVGGVRLPRGVDEEEEAERAVRRMARDHAERLEEERKAVDAVRYG